MQFHALPCTSMQVNANQCELRFDALYCAPMLGTPGASGRWVPETPAPLVAPGVIQCYRSTSMPIKANSSSVRNRNSLQSNAIQRNPMQIYDIQKIKAIQYKSRPKAIQCNSKQINAIQCNSLQSNAIHCNPTQSNAKQSKLKNTPTSLSAKGWSYRYMPINLYLC